MLIDFWINFKLRTMRFFRIENGSTFRRTQYVRTYVSKCSTFLRLDKRSKNSTHTFSNFRLWQTSTQYLPTLTGQKYYIYFENAKTRTNVVVCMCVCVWICNATSPGRAWFLCMVCIYFYLARSFCSCLMCQHRTSKHEKRIRLFASRQSAGFFRCFAFDEET